MARRSLSLAASTADARSRSARALASAVAAARACVRSSPFHPPCFKTDPDYQTLDEYNCSSGSVSQGHTFCTAAVSCAICWWALRLVYGLVNAITSATFFFVSRWRRPWLAAAKTPLLLLLGRPLGQPPPHRKRACRRARAAGSSRASADGKSRPIALKLLS